MYANAELDTWRGWLGLTNTLSDEQLARVRSGRKFDGEPFGPLAAKQDIDRFMRAARYTIFARSTPWPRSTSGVHTEACLKNYASDLDTEEKWHDALETYRAHWGKTYCHTCGGSGYVGGWGGTYWEPPEAPEECSDCLAHEAEDRVDVICPRCGTHGSIPLYAVMDAEDMIKCDHCLWTPAKGGMPDGPDWGEECTCPGAY